MAENRTVNIKVTSNAKKVLKSVGVESTKQGKKSVGILAKMKALTGGIASGFTAATGGVRAFSAALISSGVGAIVVALGSMVALLGRSINTSKDFEKALSGLKAITGASSDEMRALSSNAKELGRTTAFTASQVVQLQTEFSKLGFSTSEILDATEATLSLAAASGTDLADAATVAGNTIRSFGLDASETGMVADVMAKSFTTSALDMDKFRESMKLVAPISKVTNTSLQETSAALAVLADRGVSGSMAGTQLRRVMSDLATKTGLSFQDSLELTAKKLEAATTTAEKLSIAKTLVGDRAKGSLIALAENRDALNELAVAYDNAGGTAKNMGEENLNNLSGDIIRLSSAWEGFLLGIEDGEGLLSKFARGTIQLFTKALGGITRASEDLADGWRVRMASIKRVASRAGEGISETFTALGLNIEIFALKAKLALSNIPLIGEAIDGEMVKQNLLAAENELVASNKRISQLTEEASGESAARDAHWNQLKSDRKIRIEKKAREELAKITVDETGGTAEDPEDSAEVKRLKLINDLKRKITAKNEDLLAKDRLEKIELDRTRHLEELARLEGNETEKREAMNAINKYYDDLSNEEKALRNDKDNAERAVEYETKVAKEAQEAEELRNQEQRLLDIKLEFATGLVDMLAASAKDESDIQKGLLAVKHAILIGESIVQAKRQINNAKELMANVAKAKANVALEVAQSKVALASGTAKTAAAGFPQNIPLLAAYGGAAIGIMGAITSAVSAFKGISGGAGGGIGDTGSNFRPQQAQGAASQAPSFNVIGNVDNGSRLVANSINANNKQPIKAYVVSNEVSSEQELDNRTKDSASF